MDFELVLRNLLAALDRRSVRYGAIGGFALGALGVPRATIDLDFLVQREDLDELHALLTELGYTRTFITENVSQYRHHDSAWGSVDVLHAFRVHSRAMLQRARDHAVFGGSMRVKVLDPEDIIGLKVQAMVNDPRRRTQDEADIEALMAAQGSHLDWVRLQEFFDLFDLGEQGRALEKRYGHVDG
jgi:hypothetical protein